MRQTIFIMAVLLNFTAFGQVNDSVFAWKMRFNKNFSISDSCNFNQDKSDTFNLHGHIDTEFDTVVFTFYGSLHYDQKKYYLEFRDIDNKLVDIENSIYNIWTLQRSYPPYERYDSISSKCGEIEFSIRNLQTIPFGESFSYLDVYFYRDRDFGKHKLCTLVFIEKDEKQNRNKGIKNSP